MYLSNKSVTFLVHAFEDTQSCVPLCSVPKHFAGPAVVDQLLKELTGKVQALEAKYKEKIQKLKVCVGRQTQRRNLKKKSCTGSCYWFIY